jgi:hypothetical protein
MQLYVGLRYLKHAYNVSREDRGAGLEILVFLPSLLSAN